MRALFIESKSAGARPWLWLVLAMVLLSGGAVASWETPWMAPARELLALWRAERAEAEAPVPLAEPSPVPAAVQAWPEASVMASDSVAAAAPAAPTPEEDIDRQVMAFVEGWAASWSAKNLDGYFSAYADNFQPEGKKTLADWAKERKQRIAAKAKIAVQIKDFMIVSSDHTGLKASFIQIYEADGFHSTSPKVLLLSKQDGAWKIVREYTP